MNIDRALEVSRQVATDCDNDAGTLDGLAFNGRVVATRLGEIYAMVQALARVSEAICERLSEADIPSTPLKGATDDE